MYVIGFLLALLIRNSLSVNETQKRILLDDNNYYTLVSRLDALERDVAALKADHAKTSHLPVAFMAYLTKTITGTNHHIYFDDVRLNLGNAYNPHHGTFVAPVNGTYQFTVTACSHGGHYIVLEVTVNSSNIGKVLAGDADYSACSSKTFLAELQSGDDVYIQHVTTGDYLGTASVYGWPSFTGVLLQAE